MTVAAAGREPGRLLTITDEEKGDQEAEGCPVTFSIEKGKVFADLRIGADVSGAVALLADLGLAYTRFKLHGVGFVIPRQEAIALPPMSGKLSAALLFL